jgi:hypothetical protein
MEFLVGTTPSVRRAELYLLDRLRSTSALFPRAVLQLCTGGVGNTLRGGSSWPGQAQERWMDRRSRPRHSARDPSPRACHPSHSVRSAGPARDRQRECQSGRDSEEGEVATTAQVLRTTQEGDGSLRSASGWSHTIDGLCQHRSLERRWLSRNDHPDAILFSPENDLPIGGGGAVE